jgi:hypothetical protein
MRNNLPRRVVISKIKERLKRLQHSKKDIWVRIGAICLDAEHDNIGGGIEGSLYHLEALLLGNCIKSIESVSFDMHVSQCCRY